MDRFFNLDSPLMRFLTVVTNLIILNVLFMICSIPIFTLGASLTALNQVVLQMIRGDDTYIAKSYFKAFAQNFRQATCIWLLLLAAAVIIAVDYYAIPKLFGGTVYVVMFLVVTLIAIVWFLIWVYVFALQARYENPVKQTIKNALLLSVANLPYTVGVAVIVLILPVLSFFVEGAAPRIMMFYIIVGFAAVAYLGDMLVNRVFVKTFDLERELQSRPLWSENEEMFTIPEEKKEEDKPEE